MSEPGAYDVVLSFPRLTECLAKPGALEFLRVDALNGIVLIVFEPSSVVSQAVARLRVPRSAPRPVQSSVQHADSGVLLVYSSGCVDHGADVSQSVG